MVTIVVIITYVWPKAITTSGNQILALTNKL